MNKADEENINSNTRERHCVVLSNVFSILFTENEIVSFNKNGMKMILKAKYSLLQGSLVKLL